MKKVIALIVVALTALLPVAPILATGEMGDGSEYMAFTTAAVLPAATVGEEYQTYVEVSGVTNDYYNGTVLYGQVPPGMYWSISILKLYGTPTVPGTYPLLVQAKDLQKEVSNSIVKWFFITVN